MAKRRWLRIEDQGRGIVVDKELLGQIITIPLGTAQVSIVFPKAVARVVPGFIGHAFGVDCILSMKDLKEAGFGVSKNMEQEFGSLDCGTGVHYQEFLTPEGLTSAELRRFIYIFEAEWELDATANRGAVWEPWDSFWALCKDWLEIQTGQDIYSGSTHIAKGRQFNVWTENGDGTDAQSHAIGVGSGSSPLIASDPITRRIFESSLSRALERAQIPFDYRLLRDARRSINLGEFRKSVIDCASAIEVVLSKELIKLYLAQGKAQGSIDHLENKATLGEVINTWNVKGTHKFPNLNTSVSDLRNDIIHRGLNCGADQAIPVYDLTREILDVLGTRFEPVVS